VALGKHVVSFDRDLTKRLLAAATGWREAARVILTAEIEGTLLWPPFYTSLFYCLEQSLKAFLASRGYSRDNLKAIGHNLNVLAEKAEAEGLAIGNGRFKELLGQLEGKLLELRYLEGEAIEIAEPDEALKLVDKYFETLSCAVPLEELLGDFGR
jgi:hypothetical protein